jgi:hypothetical protein
MARGQTFERTLFRNQATRLREELEKAGVIDFGSEGFTDFRARNIGGPMASLDVALAHTREFLVDLAHNISRKSPTIVASPTLLIPSGVMLPEALLVVDIVALQYRQSTVTIKVGEVKTYPDRGGYTDSAELALARAQAGVYVHALRMVIEQLALADIIRVSDRGFLILSKPGSSWPSVRGDEDLRYQALRAARGFEMLETAALQLPTELLNNPEALIQAVVDAGTDYNERCVSFCDRVEGCRRRALVCGSPAILGDDVVRLTKGVSLMRAEEIAKGAKPKTDVERELSETLRGLA